MSSFRGTFHSFDPVGFAIFAILRASLLVSEAIREFFQLAAASFGLPLMPDLASAQVYPSRPVHLIVDIPAGLAPDVIARLVAKPLSDRLGQDFVVEDKPGAGGNVGAEYVIRAAPDGYTLLVMISGNAANAALYPNLDFNFVQDIAPIAFLGYTPFVVVVNPSVNAKTISELIAYARANPGKLNFASQGAGTAPHLAFELFRMMSDVNIVHVPYRSSYLPDLLAGQVQLAFATVPPVLGYIHTGKLRALGVTSMTRIEVLPDVSAIAEILTRLRGKRLGRRWSAEAVLRPKLSIHSTGTSMPSSPILR